MSRFIAFYKSTKKKIGTYHGITPKSSGVFAGTDVVQGTIIENTLENAYSVNENNEIVYDASYTCPLQSYELGMCIKLSKFDDYIRLLGIEFAASNSKILSDLLIAGTITLEEKEIMVKECADALKPVLEDFKLYSYPEGFVKVDAIIRTGYLLTDERLNSYKLKIQTYMASLG